MYRRGSAKMYQSPSLSLSPSPRQGPARVTPRPLGQQLGTAELSTALYCYQATHPALTNAGAAGDHHQLRAQRQPDRFGLAGCKGEARLRLDPGYCLVCVSRRLCRHQTALGRGAHLCLDLEVPEARPVLRTTPRRRRDPDRHCRLRDAAQTLAMTLLERTL